MINLTSDVVSISAAASQLAKRIAQARVTGRPIIVTQKGYPTGVLLSVEAYEALTRAAASVARPPLTSDELAAVAREG